MMVSFDFIIIRPVSFLAVLLISLNHFSSKFSYLFLEAKIEALLTLAPFCLRKIVGDSFYNLEAKVEIFRELSDIWKPYRVKKASVETVNFVSESTSKKL